MSYPGYGGPPPGGNQYGAPPNQGGFAPPGRPMGPPGGHPQQGGFPGQQQPGGFPGQQQQAPPRGPPGAPGYNNSQQRGPGQQQWGAAAPPGAPQQGGGMHPPGGQQPQGYNHMQQPQGYGAQPNQQQQGMPPNQQHQQQRGMMAHPGMAPNANMTQNTQHAGMNALNGQMAGGHHPGSSGLAPPGHPAMNGQQQQQPQQQANGAAVPRDRPSAGQSAVHASPLKHIQRSAITAWCPSRNENQLMALGTSHLAVPQIQADFSYQETPSRLEFARFNLGSSSSGSGVVDTSGSSPDLGMSIVGSLDTRQKFLNFSWGAEDFDRQAYPHGILSAAQTDGIVSLWNPHRIISSNGQDNGTRLCGGASTE